ncbi:MAG: exosome complex protein Rrp42, partial [archaeon]
VKLSIEKPFPDTPASGILIVGAELDPIASEYFTGGPPDENSIELARVVDRGIRESKCIDLEKLCIVPGEKVWGVFIDIYVLDHDGNLFDASSIAAVNALYNCYFPEIKDDKIIYEKHTDQKLPMVDIPCSTTFVKIENSLLLDPTFDEECAADARLTIVTTKDGKLCAMQKGGPGGFTEEELKTMLNISISKGAELRSLFKI